MREYTGPTKSTVRVTFVGEYPPQLVGFTHERIYLWDLRRTDSIANYPIQAKWDPNPDVFASANGRWLGTVVNERLMLRDLSAGPSRPEIAFELEGTLAARFVGRPGQLCVLRGEVVDRQNVVPEFWSWKLAGRGRPFNPAGVRKVRLPGIRAVTSRYSPGWWMCKHLSTNGHRIGLSSFDRALHVWDVPERKSLGTIRLRGFPHAAAFSPDSSKLVIDAGTTLYIHDGDDLELLTKWKVNNCEIPGLAWSPDGRLFARSDDSRTLRVYEAASGRSVMAVRAKNGRAVSVAFAPDGLTIATGTSEGPVRVWDVDW
jgi:hypothetical protein